MKRIERLSENVVNRIAAGEVVQRPSAALKELLENSLDAGSTSIQVLVVNGGLDVLQITDDGHGIHYGDLPLLCERYTTSKLRAFEDLSHIGSFGFRGEALSSISYVSRVTVTTMRRSENNNETSSNALAWRCHYVDGVMQGEPKACAGNPGTCIRVEKMFYNAAVRRRALNRPSEEYSRIVTVVSRYALAFPHVSFSCRREENSGNKVEVYFPKDSNTLANIRIFHGALIASNLHELKFTGDNEEETRTPADVLAATGISGEDYFLISGYTSGVALQNRKPYLCIFVNNRLVESTAIKRALDIVYSGILVGGNRPFTVIFITVPPDRVDVNIHPTKHEVCLLDEEIIVARLSESVRFALIKSASSRQMDTRQILSKAAILGDRGTNLQKNISSNYYSSSLINNSTGSITGNIPVAAPCTLVRVEPQRGALDEFFRRSSTIKKEENEIVISGDNNENNNSNNNNNNDSEEKDKKCDNSDLSLVIKTEKTEISQKHKEIDEEINTNKIKNNSEDTIFTSASLAASIMKLSTIDNNNDEDNETDEDGDNYVMQQFKRHKMEMRNNIENKEDLTNNEYPIENLVSVTDNVKETIPNNGEDLLLTSVSNILSSINKATSPTARSLFEKLTYVGVINENLFLAQSGTTLYAINTLHLVKLVVFQRIFLRWAVASLPSPPQLLLNNPVKILDLLNFAIEKDVKLSKDNNFSDNIRRTIKKMDRRLRHWRHMLLEYFAIDITEDGYLVALPFGLNTSWPPVPRVIPFFIWKLAYEVPYGEDEIACFTAIAKHISEILYGLRLHDSWTQNHTEGISFSEDNIIKQEDQQQENIKKENKKEEEDGSLPSLVDAIRFGLIPCATSLKFFAPPADTLIDGTIQSVVSVEELYKVFERC